MTRQLHRELEADDWDALVLHYLGMDHIGHIAGPKSPLMPAKQKEMDEIVQLIYERHLLSNPRTLLVILGDHGMNSVSNIRVESSFRIV